MDFARGEGRFDSRREDKKGSGVSRSRGLGFGGVVVVDGGVFEGMAVGLC